MLGSIKDSPAGQAVHGIDRMVRNIETGRFERSLSALTAAGALVTAAEICFEHDSASFGNKMMRLPVVLSPVGAVAGVAGVFSRRLAKTALPVASAAIVANGLQGTFLHARGIAQKPGGWSNARYNMEMGPPLLAPQPVTMVGGWGCSRPSCGGRSERPAHGSGGGRFSRVRLGGSGAALGRCDCRGGLVPCRHAA